MSGLKVGFDLDGVGFNFVEALRIAAVKYGYDEDTVAKPASTWDWFLADWGWSRGDFYKVWDFGVERGMFSWAGLVYPGFVEGLRRVHEAGGTVHIVTARGIKRIPDIAAQTSKWLNDIGVGHLVSSVTFAQDKAPFANAFDAFLDDAPHHFEEMVEAAGPGLPEDFLFLPEARGAYLLDEGYNRHVKAGARRVSSIAEYLDLIGV